MADKEIRWKVVLRDLLSSGLKGAAREVKQFERLVRGAADRITGFFRRISSAVFSVRSAIIGGLASAGALRAFGESIKQAFRVEAIQTRLAILLRSVARAKQLINELKTFSSNSGFSFDESAAGGRALLGFGVAASDVISTLKMLGNISAGSGAELESLVTIFGQVRAAGRMTGRELSQMVNAGVPMILNALSVELYGVSNRTADVRKAIEDGAVSFDIFARAMRRMTSNGAVFDGAMGKIGKTGNELVKTLKDEWIGALADFGSAFVGMAKGGLQRAIDKIRELRESGAIKKWAEEAADKIQLVKDTLLSLGKGDTETIKLSIDVLKAGVHDAFWGAVDLLFAAAPKIGALIGAAAKAIMTNLPPTSKELNESAEELGYTKRYDAGRKIVGYGGPWGVALDKNSPKDRAILEHARRKKFDTAFNDAAMGLTGEKPEAPEGRAWLPGALDRLRKHVTPKPATTDNNELHAPTNSIGHANLFESEVGKASRL